MERVDGRRAGCRGFSLVELALALVLIPIVLGIGLMTVRRSGELAGNVIDSSGSMDKMREVLRRIGDELVCSSQTGEDLNANGVLDPSEDLNGNGRLERDWAVTPTSIQFNRVLADATYSLPITYSLQNGRLLRTQLLSDGTTASAPIARRVLGFSVLATGTQLTVSLSLGPSTAPQTSTITVRQRN